MPGAARKNAETVDQSVKEDEFGAKDYRSQMVLKPDNTSRPLWVVSANYIFTKHFKTLVSYIKNE